jgi:hypothetical protein
MEYMQQSPQMALIRSTMNALSGAQKMFRAPFLRLFSGARAGNLNPQPALFMRTFPMNTSQSASKAGCPIHCAFFAQWVGSLNPQPARSLGAKSALASKTPKTLQYHPIIGVFE